MALTTAKRVKDIYKAKEIKWLGDGFPVRNVVSYHKIAHEISPFLSVDLIGPHDFDKSREILGAEELPYKGLDIVTLMYDGSVDYLDSRGNFVTLDPGDVHWVTAGSGIAIEEKHSEEFDSEGGRLEMVRIWVNLPSGNKLVAPRVQTFEAGGPPRVELPEGAGYLFVIAGEVYGVDGPVESQSPVVLLDMRLKQSKQIAMPFPSDWTAMLFVVDGKLGVENGQVVDSGELVRFDHEGCEVEFQAHLNTSAVLMAGAPIPEPVTAQDGIVMNTPQEVIDAQRDYKAGLFGEVSQEHETEVED